MGTWINGSTLYQRTFTGTTSSSSNTTLISIGSVKVKRIEVVVSIDGTSLGKNVVTASGYHYVSSSDNIGSTAYAYNDYLYVEYNGAVASTYRNKAYAVTILYTK